MIVIKSLQKRELWEEVRGLFVDAFRHAIPFCWDNLFIRKYRNTFDKASGGGQFKIKCNL